MSAFGGKADIGLYSEMSKGAFAAVNGPDLLYFP